MSFLLDTNVVSDIRQMQRASENFRTTIAALQKRETYLSAVTLTEIAMGIQLRSKDRALVRILEFWLQHGVIDVFDGRILNITPQIALLAGQLPTPEKRPTFDALIAATALHHGHTVVTRNVRNFIPLGVEVLDPWTG